MKYITEEELNNIIDNKTPFNGWFYKYKFMKSDKLIKILDEKGFKKVNINGLMCLTVDIKKKYYSSYNPIIHLLKLYYTLM